MQYLVPQRRRRSFEIALLVTALAAMFFVNMTTAAAATKSKSEGSTDAKEQAVFKGTGLVPQSHPIEFHLKSFALLIEAAQRQAKDTGEDAVQSEPGFVVDDPALAEIVKWNVVALIRNTQIKANPAYGLQGAERLNAIQTRIEALAGEMGEGLVAIGKNPVPAEKDMSQTDWLVGHLTDMIKRSIVAKPEEVEKVWSELVTQGIHFEAELPITGIENDTRKEVRAKLLKQFSKEANK